MTAFADDSASQRSRPSWSTRVRALVIGGSRDDHRRRRRGRLPRAQARLRSSAARRRARSRSTRTSRQATRSDQDRRLAALRLRRPAHPLPADEAGEAPVRRLRVELPGRQAARVLADRRQGHPLLPGQGRAAVRAQRRQGQGRVEEADRRARRRLARLLARGRLRGHAPEGAGRRPGRGAGAARQGRQAALALRDARPQRDLADRRRLSA